MWIQEELAGFEFQYKSLNFPPSCPITHDATMSVNSSGKVSTVTWTDIFPSPVDKHAWHNYHLVASHVDKYTSL